MIGKAILLVFLLLWSLEDLRKKTLWLPGLLAGVLAGVLFVLAEGTWDKFSALLPGGSLVVISWISGGAIGVGDGICLMAAGLFLGIRETVFLLLFGLLLTIPASLYYLIVRREKKKKLPFVPFLLGGYVCTLLML